MSQQVAPISTPAAKVHDAGRQRAVLIVKGTRWFAEHWVIVFSALFGVMMVAPFLAPLFMSLGWTGPADVIYGAYSLLCHQMAQRSFFLFGQQQPIAMYNLNQLPLSGSQPIDMTTLRAFIGNSTLGWKVAWSDRMVYMYVATWIGGMTFALLPRRREIRPLSIIGFALLLLPMFLDGITHFFSDIGGGLGGGFRYDNSWLATLTGNVLPQSFYVGDAFGSFNSLMRMISGICFGIGVVWFMYPRIDQVMRETAEELRDKLANAGLI